MRVSKKWPFPVTSLFTDYPPDISILMQYLHTYAFEIILGAPTSISFITRSFEVRNMCSFMDEIL